MENGFVVEEALQKAAGWAREAGGNPNVLFPGKRFGGEYKIECV